MKRLSPKSRRQLAHRLRMALAALDSGNVTVSGPSHSLATSRARLEAKIAELEREA